MKFTANEVANAVGALQMEEAMLEVAVADCSLVCTPEEAFAVAQQAQVEADHESAWAKWCERNMGEFCEEDCKADARAVWEADRVWLS